MTNNIFNPSPELPSGESFQGIPDALTRVHAGVGRLKWAIYQQFPESFVPETQESRDQAAQVAAKLVAARQHEKQLASEVESFTQSVAEDPSYAAFLESARQEVLKAREADQ